MLLPFFGLVRTAVPRVSVRDVAPHTLRLRQTPLPPPAFGRSGRTLGPPHLSFPCTCFHADSFDLPNPARRKHIGGLLTRSFARSTPSLHPTAPVPVRICLRRAPHRPHPFPFQFCCPNTINQSAMHLGFSGGSPGDTFCIVSGLLRRCVEARNLLVSNRT